MSFEFLLDTMIISESFKTRPSEPVLQWLGATQATKLAVSVMTFGEISAGIEKERQTNGAALRRLESWMHDTEVLYRERILPVTSPIAMLWGELCVRHRRKDTDLVIAATALVHDLTIATRNVRHFEATGVKLFNPYG